MKKEWTLPTLAWLAAAGGFALRTWELAVAYDPVSRRMAYPCPATWLLWVLAVVMTAAMFWLCRGMGKNNPAHWFYDPSTVSVMFTTCASFVLMAAGGLGLWLPRNTYFLSLLSAITYACCLAGGLAMLVYAAAVYRGRGTAQLPLLLMVVCVAVLTWLVATYQQHARQPITALYMWQMLAGVCIVLAVYHLITLSMDRGSATRTCVLCLLSIPLTGISLADGLSLPFTLVSLSAMLLLTTQCRMLLRAAFGPPRPERMPRGAEESELTDTKE